MTDFKNEIVNFEFNNNVSTDNIFTNASFNDPDFIQHIIDDYDFKDLDKTELKKALEAHKAIETKITKEELKEVFIMLKNRELHPKGRFDKQKRFYLYDSELVNVRSPSVAYPWSQMTAGRTAKFVKAMAEKYKVQSQDELISLFKKAKK